jgi:hypothetical protein
MISVPIERRQWKLGRAGLALALALGLAGAGAARTTRAAPSPQVAAAGSHAAGEEAVRAGIEKLAQAQKKLRRKRRGSSSPPQPAVTPLERRLEDALEDVRRRQRPDVVRRERDHLHLDPRGRRQPLSPPGTILPTPPSRARPGNDAITPMSPPGAILPTPPSMPIPGVR